MWFSPSHLNLTFVYNFKTKTFSVSTFDMVSALHRIIFSFYRDDIVCYTNFHFLLYYSKKTNLIGALFLLLILFLLYTGSVWVCHPFRCHNSKRNQGFGQFKMTDRASTSTLIVLIFPILLFSILEKYNDFSARCLLWFRIESQFISRTNFFSFHLKFFINNYLL